MKREAHGGFGVAFAWSLALLGCGLAPPGIASPLGPPQAGCQAWVKAGLITARGTSQADGFSGPLSLTLDAKSGRYVADRDYGVFTRRDGFDGVVDWARDRSGASHKLDSDPARAIAATSAWLRRWGWCATPQKGVAAEPRADESDAGVRERVWQVTPTGGVPVLLRFDASTGLLRQSEVRLWEGRLIRHFADWRDIGGNVLFPFSERDEYPEDESVEIITLASVTLGAKKPTAAMFTEPAPPGDFAIAGVAASTTVAYEDDAIGRIFAPVFLDGQGPYPFEVDTGGHFILSTATASDLRLAPAGAANATGAGQGVVKEGAARIGEVRIGEAVIRDQPAWVRAFSAASNDRGSRPPRAGILGVELFERFAVALDRKAKTLTLTPLARFRRPGGGIILPIRFTEDAPVTRGGFDGVPGDFEVDSGDAGPAIVEGYWAGEHGLSDRLSKGLVWSAGGIGEDYTETLSRGDFTLGPLALTHEVTSYVGRVERGSESTRLQAGVIGESSLYRFNMAFDYGREEIWIDPKPVVPPRPFPRSGLRLTKPSPDRMTVVLVAPGSAAGVAGVKAGDQIVSIEGGSASALAVADTYAIFGRPVGSLVSMVVAAKAGGAGHPVTLRLADVLP